MKGLRRSLHFVPGGNERMFEKALTLPADSLILDLEDAVTPDRKQVAREQVCSWLAAADFGDQEKLVRINPLDTPWGREDVEAIMRCSPDGIVVPKIRNLTEVQALDELLVSVETNLSSTSSSTPLLIIGTELAGAVFNLPNTLSHPRVNSVAWAAEDLSAEIGARTKRDEHGNYLEVFAVVRSWCLLAAVAADVQAVDGPFVDINDPEGLARECKLTADMGYTGKLTIHPSQIEIVNQAFMPSAEDVKQAEALLKAFEENKAEGRMAFSFNGEMVDVPHLKRAEGILQRARSMESN